MIKIAVFGAMVAAAHAKADAIDLWNNGIMANWAMGNNEAVFAYVDDSIRGGFNGWDQFGVDDGLLKAHWTNKEEYKQWVHELNKLKFADMENTPLTKSEDGLSASIYQKFVVTVGNTKRLIEQRAFPTFNTEGKMTHLTFGVHSSKPLNIAAIYDEIYAHWSVGHDLSGYFTDDVELYFTPIKNFPDFNELVGTFKGRDDVSKWMVDIATKVQWTGFAPKPRVSQMNAEGTVGVIAFTGSYIFNDVAYKAEARQEVSFCKKSGKISKFIISIVDARKASDFVEYAPTDAKSLWDNIMQLWLAGDASFLDHVADDIVLDANIQEDKPLHGRFNGKQEYTQWLGILAQRQFANFVFESKGQSADKKTVSYIQSFTYTTGSSYTYDYEQVVVATFNDDKKLSYLSLAAAKVVPKSCAAILDTAASLWASGDIEGAFGYFSSNAVVNVGAAEGWPASLIGTFEGAALKQWLGNVATTVQWQKLAVGKDGIITSSEDGKFVTVHGDANFKYQGESYEGAHTQIITCSNGKIAVMNNAFQRLNKA